MIRLSPSTRAGLCITAFWFLLGLSLIAAFKVGECLRIRAS